MRERGFRPVLAVPLIADEQVTARPAHLSREVRAFGDLEIDFAQLRRPSRWPGRTPLRCEPPGDSELSAALNEINAVIHPPYRVEEIGHASLAAGLGGVGADSAMVAVRHGDDWVAE